MINYIIQVVLFQVLFLAIYDLFLAKETFFNYNRTYLLSTPIIALLLPSIKIPTFQKVATQEFTQLLPEVLLSPQTAIEKTEIYSSINYFSVLFYSGVAVFSLFFLIKLAKIVYLILKYKPTKKSNYKLVVLPKNTAAFSFFNYIFLGEKIPKEKLSEIIQHELIHSKQKHTLDLLFFEILRIIMWFNPMSYIYQKRITLLHEYISDDEVLKTKQKQDYFNTILSEAFQVENISFTNHFYKKSLIKKRITMMTKRKSKNTNRFKYLLLIPVLASMLIYTSCEKEQLVNTETTTQNDNSKLNKPGRLTIIEEGQPTKKIVFKSIQNEVFNTFKNNKDKSVKTHIQTDFSDKDSVHVTITLSKSSSNLYNNAEDVPFTIVEEAPIFPGCENSDSRNCFKKSIDLHIKRKFNSSIANSLGLTSGKKRIFIMFKIDTNGEIADVQARAPHPDLVEEAIRVVKTLPKMTPAKQRGRIVNTRYYLPITFMVE